MVKDTSDLRAIFVNFVKKKKKKKALKTKFYQLLKNNLVKL